MRWAKYLIAISALLWATTSAHAFVAIGNLVISAMLAVGAGGLLPVASAGAIGLAAVGVGLSVANVAMSFLGRKPSANPNDIKNTTRGSEGPGREAFGRVEIEGEIAFGNTAGYRIYRLILHCFGVLSAVEEYFYDGRSITVDSDGQVSSPPWRTSSGSYLNIQTKIGDGNETSWDDLQTDFPTLWTPEHRVRGIVQSLLRATNPGTGDSKFLRLYQGGIKALKLRVRMGLFYDPRTDANGWTLNGVLHVLHYLRRLPGNDDAIYDFTDIGLVASQAEQEIATLDGAAPFCQLSGGWKGPITTEIVTDMLLSAGLEVVDTDDGLYTLEFIEDDPASELTLYDRHILERDHKTGPDGAKRPNICKLTYFSPERRYETAELPLHERDPDTGEYIGAGWARIPDEIAKYGEQEFPVDLIFCCDASQAQRIARRLFHMARAEFGVFRTHFAGMACWSRRVITLEFPDVGEDGGSVFKKCRIGTVRVNDEDGTCEVPYQVIPDELTVPWDGTTMEVPPPPVLEALEYESELDKPAIPSAAAVVQLSDGSYETRLAFTGVSGGETAEAQYRSYADGLPNQWAAMEEYAGHTTGWYAWVAVDARDRADFRVAFYNDDDEGSYFSDPLEVDPLAIDNTPPDAPIVDGSGTNTLQISTTQLRVVEFLVETNLEGDFPDAGWSIAAQISDIRPGTTPIEVILSGFEPSINDYTVNWRISALTSDGTQGSFAEGSFVVSGTGTT